MSKEIIAIMAVLGALLLSGCAASLEDFQNMSAQDRATYICNKHPKIKSMYTSVQDMASLIGDSQRAIANGYRTHTSCSKVPSVVPITNCYGYHCYTSTRTVYNTVCQDLPVAIDANLEKEKLKNYLERDKELRKAYDIMYAACHRPLLKMHSEEAFDYYQHILGGSTEMPAPSGEKI